MKIDFSAPITGLDGRQIEEDGVPMTLGVLCIGVLTMLLADVRGQLEQLEAKAKVANALLAQRIHLADGAIEISIEEAHTLKERLGRACGPVALMRAWELLEGSDPARAGV